MWVLHKYEPSFYRKRALFPLELESHHSGAKAFSVRSFTLNEKGSDDIEEEQVRKNGGTGKKGGKTTTTYD